MPDFESIPYRIRIGVTGHRRLEEAAAVETTARQELVAFAVVDIVRFTHLEQIDAELTSGLG